jgi:hypothetical protein
VKAPCNRLRPFSSRTYGANVCLHSEQGAAKGDWYGHTSCFHMGTNSLASFFSRGGSGVPIWTRTQSQSPDILMRCDGQTNAPGRNSPRPSYCYSRCPAHPASASAALSRCSLIVIWGQLVDNAGAGNEMGCKHVTSSQVLTNLNTLVLLSILRLNVSLTMPPIQFFDKRCRCLMLCINRTCPELSTLWLMTYRTT